MASLGSLYQQSMLKHPYGYALYEPESSQNLKPGYCGYLTELGQWTPLLGVDHVPIDLGDPTSLSRNGLTPFLHFSKAPSDTRSWGPKTCGRMKQRSVSLSAGASLIPAGIPASIGALYQYSSKDGFGALLMTKSPVTKNAVYGSAPFRLWCKENLPAIVQRWPDVKERGLIIVNSTYTTPFAAVNAWTESGKEVTVGFSASAVEIGEIAPSCTWFTAENDDGWVTSAASDNNDAKVVFFGGLYFKYRRLAPILPQSHAFSSGSVEKATFRSSGPEDRKFSIIEKSSDGITYEILVTSEDMGEMIELPQEIEEEEDF